VIRIGVIADTHGLLRPQATALLRGSDLILHAGDIVDPAILDSLRALAPLTAVRGNNDRGAWAEALSETELVRVGGSVIYLIHDLKQLDVDPVARGIDVVISGHSHRPSITRRNGVLYLNPGSAGPRRFKLPIALAELSLDEGSAAARIIEIEG
jgi:putative phosphoesterase